MNAPLKNLLDFDREEMQLFFQGLGEKPYRAQQVLKWIHQIGIKDIEMICRTGIAQQPLKHAPVAAVNWRYRRIQRIVVQYANVHARRPLDDFALCSCRCACLAIGSADL